MNALVTGATGFIGSHLVDRLLNEGHTVTALVRPESDRRWLTGKSIQIIEGDLHHQEALKQSVISQDWIFHVAGMVRSIREEDFEKVNSEGTANLMVAIEKYNPNVKKVIYLSSLEAGGPSSLTVPKSENESDNPVTAYGRSKLKGEKSVLAYQTKIPVVSIRPPLVYGPRDIGIYEFFKTLKYHFRISIGTQARYASSIYIDDLIDAIILCTTTSIPSGECYYVTDNEPIHSWIDMQNLFAQGINKKPFCTVYIPIPIFFLICLCGDWIQRIVQKAFWLNRTRYISLTQVAWLCNSYKIQKKLGFSPKVSLIEGSQRTWKWYRQEGWL